MEDKDKKKCDMNEFEEYMAKQWGTPQGLAVFFLSFAGFLVAIGIFIWLLHLAGLF